MSQGILNKFTIKTNLKGGFTKMKNASDELSKFIWFEIYLNLALLISSACDICIGVYLFSNRMIATAKSRLCGKQSVLPLLALLRQTGDI